MSKAKKTYTARAIDRLGATAVLWVALNVVSDLVSAVAAGVDLYLLMQFPAGTPLGPYGEIPDGTGLSAITGVVRIAALAVTLVTSFLVLKWIYRANRNAHAFARGLKNSPPWAVGWFFVPFAALIKPYEAMSETWCVSHDPEGWKTKFAPDMMRVWWGFWLIGSIAGNLTFRSSLMATETQGLLISTVLELISTLGFIVAGLAIRVIIKRITIRQTDLIAGQASAAGAAPATTDPSRPWGEPDGPPAT